MRRLAASLLGGLLLTALTFVPGASATTVTEGHCTDDTSVTVVVDYQELGTTVVRCVNGLPTGSTGFDALTAAGFVPTGTIHDGPGFVCRIDGRPAADETLTVDGKAYRESCIRTPPSSAFWSYWHSQSGGDWTFSNFGIANREVIPGGYEGWSFSLNRSEQTNPPPRVRPSRPVDSQEPSTTAKATPPPRPEPSPGDDRTTATDSAAESRQSASASPSSEAPRQPAPQPSTAAEERTSSSPVDSSPEPTEVGTPPAPLEEPSPSATVSPTIDPGSEPPAPPVEAVSVEQTVPVGTVAGVGAIGAAAAAAGVVWWRRRQG